MTRPDNSTNRWIKRDYDRAQLDATYAHQKRERLNELALIGAKALATHRDDSDLFDISLVIVEALSNAGVVFASVGKPD